MRSLKWMAAAAYYLVLLLAGLVWLKAFVPMAFLTHCSITNRSDSAIVFTPVGTVGVVGLRRSPPLHRTHYPFFMKSRRGHFSVPPGSTYKFCYDMDDINFSEIVIQDDTGTIGQIVVNPDPTEGQYIAPKVKHVTFSTAAQLSPATPDTLHVFTRTTESTGLWEIYVVSGSLLCIETLRRRIAAKRGKEGTAAA